MGESGDNNSGKSLRGEINRLLLKAKYALYCALLFFLFANPYTYEVTNSWLSSFMTVLGPSGQPTPAGFGLHLILFFLTLWGLMISPA
jgi:hypothetical protein